MATNEEIKQARQALKDAGYNARKVTIRADRYSMGCTVRATIRDASVDASKVSEIVRGSLESIRRCEVTGEILSGGNTYVDLKWTDDVEAALTADVVAPLKAAIEAARELTNYASTLIPVEGIEGVHVGHEHGDDFKIWADDAPLICWVAEGSDEAVRSAAFRLVKQLKGWPHH